MSAFQVSAKSVSKIAEHITLHVGAGCSKSVALDVFQMNLDAIRVKYGADELEDEFEFIPGSLDEQPTCSDLDYIREAQLYKTLRCFLYQCSEGTIPSRRLYIFIEDLCSQLKQKTIERYEITPEEFEHAFDLCEWE